jgi:hypothetical protein
VKTGVGSNQDETFVQMLHAMGTQLDTVSILHMPTINSKINSKLSSITQT